MNKLSREKSIAEMLMTVRQQFQQLLFIKKENKIAIEFHWPIINNMPNYRLWATYNYKTNHYHISDHGMLSKELINDAHLDSLDQMKYLARYYQLKIKEIDNKTIIYQINTSLDNISKILQSFYNFAIAAKETFQQ